MQDLEDLNFSDCSTRFFPESDDRPSELFRMYPFGQKHIIAYFQQIIFNNIPAGHVKFQYYAIIPRGFPSLFLNSLLALALAW